MVMKTFVVEDEPHSLSRLKTLLSEIQEISIIGQADNGIQAVSEINKLRPELVFMDINLPGKNGFEVISALEYRPKIIFITAYQEYAIKAFEENAVDYLLKPISLERLQSAVNKVIQSNKTLEDNVINIIKKYMNSEKYLTRFSIKLEDEILILNQQDVFYFKAEDKYVFLCTYDKEYYYDNTLKNLEELLDPSVFLRIHKSYIVSISKIERLKKWFLSEYSVELSDKAKSSLKVGRNFLPGLKDKLHF
ncbi:MAG TPA: LytTR family DNA-binding domain-containing protein [Petrotogaceae bacterium]|nr:LytTR family DNA-binding domain-containing protein [Petrotogaceae bacterium]